MTAGIDWGLPPQDVPPESPPAPAVAEAPAAPAAPKAPDVQPLEVNPQRRRRAEDLIVEPGDDVRAMARLLGQSVEYFVAMAVTDRLNQMRDKLRA